MKTVTVVDYGMGNLFSVGRALARCGAETVFTDSAAGVDAADRLILPGVGAFADGMHGLRTLGLIEPLRRYAMAQRRFLGICLGMQMMLDVSLEFGRHEGLGLIPGSVVDVPTTTPSGGLHKVPHIGWSELQLSSSRNSWDGTVLNDVAPMSAVYFVHSFMAQPSDPTHRLADVDYDGVSVCAAISRGKMAGTQFHPEKSGEVGLSILRAFLAL